MTLHRQENVLVGQEGIQHPFNLKRTIDCTNVQRGPSHYSVCEVGGGGGRRREGGTESLFLPQLRAKTKCKIINEFTKQ